MGIPNEFGG